MIDTAGSIEIGRHLEQTIRATTDTSICYVIDTHVHYDHIPGNKAFQKHDDVEFVGHAELADAIAGNRTFLSNNCRSTWQLH